MSARAEQSCERCRIQKRKCDKILPVCSLCKRLNKPCSHPAHPETPRIIAFPDLPDLTPSNIRYTLETQVFSVIGDGLKLREAASVYFRTIHTWLPVVSEAGYYAKLSKFRVEVAPSDFSFLTLCMFLVCVMPVDGQMSLETRRLYILVKSFVGMLEGIGTSSLMMLQGRLLLTTFEIGHAAYPSAYISAGANIHAAVSLGASATSAVDLSKTFPDPQVAEEAQHTWRGIIITNRYASLERSAGRTPSLGQSTEAVLGDNGSNYFTQMDPFNKMAYSSFLSDQVLGHIHQSHSQNVFNRVEAIEILNSLTSFLSSFRDEGKTPQIILGGALAICRSAMLEILDFGAKIKLQNIEYCTQTSFNILASVTHEIAHEARGVATNSVGLDALPVFIPHCIYKAIMVYLHNERISEGDDPNLLIQPLKKLLGYIGLRWGAGKYYLAKIEQEQKRINC